MPPERIHRAQRVRGVGPSNLSRRQVRGAGWHRRGWRDRGCMWINVKEGSYGAVHGTDVNENQTLTEFVEDIAWYQSRGACYPHEEGWTWDLFFRRKSLVSLLEEFKEEGRAEGDDLVRDFFDGGETVIWKVYDEYGEERVFNGDWEYHRR
ncbi:uncharacterized protein GGS22DRAFT_62326 [Annulohypoxylon maeteangense]|uniref:uncharacterized protein n=1 Tax=Annulohypoxylon maeteangense TaxID=1927788 RepID=UPI002007AF5E|nr:uncharacterized protein GGS22DRAFT_62326 [Annulohypoxylon maeteangense]KAI0888698.1 hypothetical protein GGS22DRAFT_62326 [Annulohypoxylon maeteangense]